MSRPQTADPSSLLKEHLDALSGNIFSADRAYAILRAIGENAERLNAGNFGDLFGYLQDVLADHFGLGLTKVFEQKNERYALHTIPTTLEVLKDNADHFIPRGQHPHLRSVLARRGLTAKQLDGESSPPFTTQLVESYRDAMPTVWKAEACGLSNALKAWRARRDKHTAHQEAVSLDSLPSTTWAESQRLLDFAKDFVSSVGFAYLGIAYTAKIGWTDQDEYLLTSDATSAAVALNRLLTAAGLRSQDWGHPR